MALSSMGKWGLGGEKKGGEGNSTWPTHPVQSCPSKKSSELGGGGRRGLQRRCELSEGGRSGFVGRKGNSVGSHF